MCLIFKSLKRKNKNLLLKRNKTKNKVRTTKPIPIFRCALELKRTGETSFNNQYHQSTSIKLQNQNKNVNKEFYSNRSYI